VKDYSNQNILLSFNKCRDGVEQRAALNGEVQLEELSCALVTPERVQNFKQDKDWD